MTSLFFPSTPSNAGTGSFRSVDVVIRWHSGTVHIPCSRGINTRGGCCISPPSLSRVIAGTGAGAISLDSHCRESSDVNANFIGTRKVLKQLNPVKPDAEPRTTRKQEEADSDINRLDIEGENKKVMDVLGDVLEKVERLENEKLVQTSRKKVNNKVNVAPLQNLGMPNIKHQSGRLANSAMIQKVGMPKSVWRKGDPIPCRSNSIKDSLDISKVESDDSRSIRSEKNLEVPLEANIHIRGLSVSSHSAHTEQVELRQGASVSMQQFEGISNGVASVSLHAAQSEKDGAVNDCQHQVSLTVAQMNVNAQSKVSVGPKATPTNRGTCISLKPSYTASPALVQHNTQTAVFISASPNALKHSVASHLESRQDVKSAKNQVNQATSVAGRTTNEQLGKAAIEKPLVIDKNKWKVPGSTSVSSSFDGHTDAILFTKSDDNSHLVKVKAEDEKENSEEQFHTKKEENGLQGTDDRMVDFSSSQRPVVSRVKKMSRVRRNAEKFKKENDKKAPLKAEILEVGAEGMLVKDLAADLAVSEGEILRQLYSKGVMPDGVQMLDASIVKIICNGYGVEVIDEVPGNVGKIAKNKDILDGDDLEKLESRPPVLTIMGHVDHGKTTLLDHIRKSKTTLLDHIRKSKVVSSEAGGITQKIGAYNVMIPVDGKLHPCVFLDTPGHEAFAAMRARGTRITDIAVIVVAADDGVKPQTNEAITHAKTAGVPIIIAINKMDKNGANPERVMEELLSIGLIPEDYGGDVPVVQISALKGDNVDDLMEIITLVAELQELKANPHCEARGTVIEAGLNKSKGPTITLLVQNGTLRRSDIVVCGNAFGKVRALFDDDQRCVDQAGPSSPVQVIGLNGVPVAGDAFEVVRSFDVARKMAAVRSEELRIERISARAADGKVTMSSIAAAAAEAAEGPLDLYELNIILKVNLQGSIGAIRQALQMLPQNNVCVSFLLEGTGDVTTSDIDLAFVSKAIVVGFDVQLPSSVRRYAEHRLVEIRLYRIIYDVIDDVRRSMEGLLRPVEEDVGIGSAQVRAIFSIGSSHVAGCIVTDGCIISGCGLRVYRRDQILHTAPLHSLRVLKEEVKEVTSGGECGIGIKDFHNWKVGDILHAFTTVRKKPSLEDAAASVSATMQSFQS